jgi:hypothetical protein
MQSGGPYPNRRPRTTERDGRETRTCPGPRRFIPPGFTSRSRFTRVSLALQSSDEMDTSSPPAGVANSLPLVGEKSCGGKLQS